MYNQRNYYSSQNSRGGFNPYSNVNPYNQPPYAPHQPRQPPPQQQIKAIDGIPILYEYQPQKGDAMVIEEAVFKGEVVKVGDKRQETMAEEEAMVSGEGYASEDGKHWKHLPKIMMNVFKLGQLQIKNVTKVKARYENSLAHHKILKISCSDKDYYLAFAENNYNQWFLKLVWSKLILEKRDCDDYGRWAPLISGKIYKKSKIMGDWEPKWVAIDSKSLRVAKDANPAVQIEISSTKQIWTRFEEIKGGYYLVVKLWNGILKQEFAVPTALCMGWLYHFLGLLSVK